MTSIHKCLIFISCLLLSTIVQAQQQNDLFVKYFGLKSGISSRHNDIIIDNRGRVITASTFGIEAFDGRKWERKNIFKQSNKLPIMWALSKDSIDSQQLIVAGRYQIGFVKYKAGKYYFEEIANQTIIDSILGGYVVKIIQQDKDVFFLGLKGVVVFNRSTKQITQWKNQENIGWLFNYYQIGKNIILLDNNGNAFVIKNKQWVKTDDFIFLKKYIPHLVVKLKNGKTLLITREGIAYVFYEKRNEFIKQEALSEFFKGNYAFKYQKHRERLFIKSNKSLLIYDLKKDKIVFLKRFKKKFLTSFDVDQSGNFWVSSPNGVFFVETNLSFNSVKNDNEVLQRKYIKNLVIEVKKNRGELLITKNGNVH